MILLVGYGYWGKNLARNFSGKLHAICESDEEKIKLAKSIYPNIKYYTDIDTALKDENIRAVALATKANTHFKLATKCIDAGKDLWIEKPVCETLEQTKELSKYSEKNNKIVFVDHTFCYHPAVVKMKKINIGTPLYYDSTRISLGLFQPDVDVSLDLAIHDASIINYLYPDLELKDKTIIRNNHVNDIANQVIVNLKFNNGFTANINCNWVSPVKKRQIILAGTESSIVYDDLDQIKLKVYETGDIDQDFNSNSLGDIYSPKTKNTEALANATKEWISCLTTRNKPLTDISNTIKPMEWIS